MGSPTRQSAGRVAAGHLHRVHHGVYAVGHTGLTPEGRWLAAVKACGPDAILGRSCSVMLFGLWPVQDRRPEVTVPHGQVRAPAGIRVHRTRSLHPEDVVRHRGIPTTSAARTIMDLAATLEDVPLRRLMSRAQSMHLTNLRLLGRQLDRAAGRPGRARFARVLATQPPATRTELEDRVYDLLSAAGLTPPHVNVPLHLDGRRVIPDFRWPEHHLIVEADSTQWHDTPQARARTPNARRSSKPTANTSSADHLAAGHRTAPPGNTVRRVALQHTRRRVVRPHPEQGRRAWHEPVQLRRHGPPEAQEPEHGHDPVRLGGERHGPAPGPRDGSLPVDRPAPVADHEHLRGAQVSVRQARLRVTAAKVSSASAHGRSAWASICRSCAWHRPASRAVGLPPLGGADDAMHGDVTLDRADRPDDLCRHRASASERRRTPGAAPRRTGVAPADEQATTRPRTATLGSTVGGSCAL